MTTSPVTSEQRSTTSTVAATTTDEQTSATATSAGTDADAGGDANTGLNPTDHAIAAQSIGMEIAIRDLIRDAGGDETMQQIGMAHEAFATRIAGISGIPASTADEEFMGDYESAFGSDAAAAVEGAEFDAAERYVGWMRQITDSRLIAAFASIAVAESRQGSLLAMGTGLEAAIDGTTGAGS